jgi:hypothetical protein
MNHVDVLREGGAPVTEHIRTTEVDRFIRKFGRAGSLSEVFGL